MNNPNIKPIETNAAQEREYTRMEELRVMLASACAVADVYGFHDAANGLADVISDHESATAAFLEEHGITDV